MLTSPDVYKRQTQKCCDVRYLMKNVRSTETDETKGLPPASKSQESLLIGLGPCPAVVEVVFNHVPFINMNAFP